MYNETEGLVNIAVMHKNALIRIHHVFWAALLFQYGSSVLAEHSYPPYESVAKCTFFKSYIQDAMINKRSGQRIEVAKEQAIQNSRKLFNPNEKKVAELFAATLLNVYNTVYSATRLTKEQINRMYVDSCANLLGDRYGSKIINRALYCRKKAFTYRKYAYRRDKGVPIDKATQWVNNFRLASNKFKEQEKEYDEFIKTIHDIYTKPYKSPDLVGSDYYAKCNQ